MFNFIKSHNFPSIKLREGDKRGELFTKSGFTFIEILVYMGLLGTFILVLSSLLFAILDVKLESVASSDVDLDGQYVLARLGYDIRRAAAVTLPGSLGVTANGLNLTISGATYSYATASGNLELTVSGTSHRLNSVGTSVSNFSVTRLGNPSGKNSLLINLNLVSNTVSLHQIPQIRNYQTTVNLR